MKKKTIVVLEVEYEFDETKTTQEFAEQDAINLAVHPNFYSVQNGTKLVSVDNLDEREMSQTIASKLLERDGYFHITSVHRDDLKERGFDTSEVTDVQMRELASKMCDDYCTQMFHESMESLADCMGFPRCEDLNEDIDEDEE